MRSALFVLLVAVIGPVSAAVALPLEQDDAGSGTDAPGEGPGTRIAPGSYRGQLVFGQDTEDRYAFQADLGDEVLITFDASVVVGTGDVVMTVHRPDGSLFGGEGDFLADQAGEWTLVMGGVATATYAWTLGIQAHPIVYQFWSTAPAASLELQVDAPTNVRFQIATTMPITTGSAERTFGLVEVWGSQGGVPFGMEHLSGVDIDPIGNVVRFGSDAFEVPAVDIAVAVLGGPLFQALDDFHGSARLVSLSSQSRITSLTVVSSVALAVATVEETRVDHWKASDQGNVVAPGIHVSGETMRTFQHDGDLVGFVGSFAADITLVAPDGGRSDARYTPPFAARSQLGEWGAIVEPRSDVVAEDSTYYLGANVPRLGLHNPPRR